MWFGINYCINIMPLKVKVKSKNCVMIYHPQSIAELHYVIVPRKRIGNIEAFLMNAGEWLSFVNFIEENLEFRNVSLCCNSGCRQEVNQVHFHVFSKNTLDKKEDEKVENCNISGHQVKFSERGNIYIKHEDLRCTEYLQTVVARGKIKYLKGFSLIFS